MDYIDISITDTNGNTKTLPGINKEYVSRKSGKYSTYMYVKCVWMLD